MSNPHAPLLARAEAPFLDDLPEPAGLLHAFAITSTVARGHLRRMDLEAVRRSPGVAAVLTAADIPAANQIGGIIQDEPLLAEEHRHFVGQPLALVVAATPAEARRAAAAATLEVEALEPLLDPRAAAAAGELIGPRRTLELGDVDGAWAACDVVVSGRVESGSQEHCYLETQAAMALPLEGGRLRLLSSTQSPTLVQRIAARVLGLPMSAVEVEVTRLGGAFGGKEDQATPWAVLASLAAVRLGRPVKVVLSRHEDMRLTGKRHPYSSDFRLGLDASGKMLAYEVTFYQNAGAAADLSPAILERTLFHATGCYFVPNVRATGLSCRTNLPPFTAFRGFGAPQAAFVMECAVARAAGQMGMPPHRLQRLNLLREGDEQPTGMRVERCRAERTWEEAASRFRLAETELEVAEHNRRHRLAPRGVAMMPICFGVSFTNTFLNQAGALVHVYTDGSVAVSTGAVEMGQGVTAKIRAVASRTLGVDPERVRVESTSTARVANASPTAASTGADLNGKATELACAAVRERLRAVAAERLGCPPEQVEVAGEKVLAGGEDRGLTWPELVWLAYTRRVDLSAHAHYATPRIHYDKTREKGQPFAYHVWGAALVEVTLDALRGTYRVDRVRAVHDGGRSLDPLVDRGQVEGAVAQGVGWLTMEELVWDPSGRLLTDSLTTYKVPDIHTAPEVETVFLADADNPEAVLQSKAIGEPPFLYGIGAYFALLQAMRAHRPDRPGLWDAPLTPEKVLMFLAGDDQRGGEHG